jgi:hypothetical protein
LLKNAEQRIAEIRDAHGQAAAAALSAREASQAAHHA